MNQVVGFQITAKDESLLNGFYASAFGWEGRPGPHEHVTDVDTGNSTLDGSIIGRGEYIPDYVSLIIASDDLEGTLHRITEAGGGMIRPPFTLENGDRLAIAEDPEGHVLTLIHRPAT